MLVMTVLSVTVASTTPMTTRAIAEHSILVSRLFVTRHCTHACIRESVPSMKAALCRAWHVKLAA